LRASHYITLAVAIAFVAILYWVPNTIPPPKKPSSEMQRPNSGGMVGQAPARITPISIDSLLAASRQSLAKGSADSIITIEKNYLLYTIHPKWCLCLCPYQSYGSIASSCPWQLIMGQKLLNWKIRKKPTFAGQFYLQLNGNESSASIQSWEAGEAVSCLEPVFKDQSG
jgi:hypothetical protein